MSEPSKLDLKNALKEERKEKLSPVSKDFYEQAQKLILDLRIELERMDPGNIKYQILEDEYYVAKKNYNSILETRMTKINYEASVRKSLKKQDDREPENMTPEERDFYNGLFALMSNFRIKHLEFLTPIKVRDTAPVALPEPVNKPVPRANNRDYVTVRMMHDIPMFAGMDGRHYTLAKEDVATMPVVNANALISRGVAVQINTQGYHKS